MNQKLFISEKLFTMTLLFWMSLLSINVYAQEVIVMKKEERGIYTVPCEVNGLKLRFIFDTGASSVSISLTEASFMLKNGYLDDEDIIGKTNVQTADGNIDENYVINLKKVQIGTIVLNNVEAVVSTGLDAPLLLGQSVLDKLGHWSIKNNSLVLNDYSNTDDDGEYTWDQLENMLRNGDKQNAMAILRKLVNKGDDYAADLFLSYIADFKDASPNLLNDSDVSRAITLLENKFDGGADDIYWNYNKIIWFSLYRLNDTEMALDYFTKVENMNVLSKEQYDKLADKIIMSMGWGSKGNVEESLANNFFEKGYYDAYTTFATYLSEIKNTPIKAFNAYKKCSEKGFVPASIKLGVCYIDGDGTPRNRQMGLSLLDKAAHQGFIEAITELCSRYYYGDGVQQNFDKVLSYARLYGHEGHCDILNNAYTGIGYWGKKEYKFANQYLKDIDLFYDTYPGEDKYNAYNNGLNRIDCEILAAVGESYEKGLGGALDLDKAFKYYNRLVKRDPAWGYGMLGDMFFLNELVQSDPERAYQYYVLGANNDSGYCCFRLALMNYYGVGTYRNTIKAKEYKDRAINHGFKSTDFNF